MSVSVKAAAVFFILCGDDGREPDATYTNINQAMQDAASAAHYRKTWCEVWKREEVTGDETCIANMGADGDVHDGSRLNTSLTVGEFTKKLDQIGHYGAGYGGKTVFERRQIIQMDRYLDSLGLGVGNEPF